MAANAASGRSWLAMVPQAEGSCGFAFRTSHTLPLVPENQEFPFEVRQLLYGRKPHLYRVLFTIEADLVVVLHWALTTSHFANIIGLGG
jgi:hypothetical protein